jgi:YgiT-type zinc finger domain-containing protein
MKCHICNNGETQKGLVTVTLDRGGVTLVYKAVPAEICENCGEEYISAETTANLLKQADAAVRAGVEVEVKAYVAA